MNMNMNLNPMISREIHRHYEADRQHAAARQRIARIALAERLYYSPLLVTIGKRLVTLGVGLQTRYHAYTDNAAITAAGEFTYAHE